MTKLYLVEIHWPDGTAKRYAPAHQTSENGIWVAALARAHLKARVICQCPGPGERRLVVRHYRLSNKFKLAIAPNGGDGHSTDCSYYRTDPNLSGLRGYATGVITEREDGGVSVRLERGLTSRMKSQSVSKGPEVGVHQPQGRAGDKRAAMKLLGLLHLLWTRSALNRWYPAMEGKRYVRTVHRALRRAAVDIHVGRMTIDSVLMVASQETDKKEVESNNQRFSDAIAKSQRTLIIAPLAAYPADKLDGKIPIKHFHGIPRIYVHSDTWASVQHSFATAISAWRRGAEVVCIVQAEAPKPGKRYVNALDIALMPVSKNWIPFDSSYEHTLTDKLTSESRSFEKPLCYDCQDAVFPDFLLLDMNTHTPMPVEVFGFTTQDYLTRKEAKRAHYDREYGQDGWWYWEASSSPTTIPDLPAPRPPGE